MRSKRSALETGNHPLQRCPLFGKRGAMADFVTDFFAILLFVFVFILATLAFRSLEISSPELPKYTIQSLDAAMSHTQLAGMLATPIPENLPQQIVSDFEIQQQLTNHPEIWKKSTYADFLIRLPSVADPELGNELFWAVTTTLFDRSSEGSLSHKHVLTIAYHTIPSSDYPRMFRYSFKTHKSSYSTESFKTGEGWLILPGPHGLIVRARLDQVKP